MTPRRLLWLAAVLMGVTIGALLAPGLVQGLYRLGPPEQCVIVAADEHQTAVQFPVGGDRAARPGRWGEVGDVFYCQRRTLDGQLVGWR